MNEKPAETERNPDDFLIQDGCRAPSKAPWSPWVSRTTTLAFVIMFALGVYILVQGSVITLAVWLGLVFLFAVPARYLLCARCPYYGQHCSTGFGKFAPFLFKKQEGKSLVPGLWMDLSAMIIHPVPASPPRRVARRGRTPHRPLDRGQRPLLRDPDPRGLPVLFVHVLPHRQAGPGDLG